MDGMVILVILNIEIPFNFTSLRSHPREAYYD